MECLDPGVFLGLSCCLFVAFAAVSRCCCPDFGLPFFFFSVVLLLTRPSSHFLRPLFPSCVAASSFSTARGIVFSLPPTDLLCPRARPVVCVRSVLHVLARLMPTECLACTHLAFSFPRLFVVLGFFSSNFTRARKEGLKKMAKSFVDEA